GCGRRHSVRARPNHHQSADGCADRPEGVRGSRFGRYWQYSGRGFGRAVDRFGRAAHRRLLVARLPRRGHVRDPDRDPDPAPRGLARRGSPGEGVMLLLRRLAIASAVGLALYAVGLWMQNGLIEYVQRIVLLAGINVILAV